MLYGMVIDGHCTECDGNGYHVADCPDNPVFKEKSAEIGSKLAAQIFKMRGNRSEIHLSQLELAVMLALAAEAALRCDPSKHKSLVPS